MKLKLPCTMIALASLICSSIQTPAWAQWQLQATLPGSPALTSVKAVSRDVAWTCSGNGSVYRTTDGGKTWNPTTKPAINAALLIIEALNATTAFVGSVRSDFSPGNSKIYRTTDGGQTWQLVYTATGPASAWSCINFFDSQNGIAISDPVVAGGNFLIVKTADAGTTWAPVANLPDANPSEWTIINCFYFHDSLNGWFATAPSAPGGTGGRIFRTTDGGNTWTGFASGNTAGVSGVTFISPLIGIRTAFDTPPLLTRSVDGGQTWTAVNNLPVANIAWLLTTTSVNTTNSHQLWLAGRANGPFILSSIDGGVTWVQQTISGSLVDPVFHMSAVRFGAASDSVQAWGITLDLNTYATGGQILTYRQHIGVVTSVQEQAPLPTEYSLSQNYPNPFNPETNIEYDLPRPGWVKVAIYNSTGQLVRTLFRSHQTAGRFKLGWNGEMILAGGGFRCYIYRLKAGEFSATKKMVLAR
jgi:photosystem II stability/assembly factor-like uncharacterized protein